MDALEAFFTSQNILTRTLQLQQDFLDRTNDISELSNRYKQLDRIITEGMLSAEKSCCRSKHGSDYEHLHTLSTLLDIEDDASLTMSEIDQQLTETRKALKLVQKNAAAARDTHLEELA
eukprot:1971919-Ditylum_brightwellii.AAC.1